MSNIFSLKGKVAAITGGTRGIGNSLALALAEFGADIALLQRNTSQIETKKEIEAIGQKCIVLPCDLENKRQIKEAIPLVISKFGHLDILVNSAGIQRRSSAKDFSENNWNDVIDINLNATWLLSQAAGRHMLANQTGKIINLGSLLSYQGGINVPAYAASKGGVVQLTKALSNEWAKYNVNVNAIIPGYITTEMNTALMKSPERNQQISNRIPANKWGAPDDFKGAIVYLASDASNYVHGHSLVVDGGWMGR